MKTKNNTTFPQTIEIPQPLEVHPSIPADLAEVMLSVADKIAANPSVYNGSAATFRKGECGCICALAMGRPMAFDDWIYDFPGPIQQALGDIYGEANLEQNIHNPAWAIERISTFLRTAK